MCPWESQFQNNFNLVWFGRKQVDFWKGGIRGSLNITKYATQDIFWLWRCQLSASKSFPYSFFYIFSVSRSHKNRDGAEVANHSPSVRVWPQSICKVRATQLHSVQPGLYVLCAYSKRRESIYKHTICFNIPCSKKRCSYMLVLDHGLGLVHHNTEEEMVRCLRHKSYIFCLSAGYSGQTCMSNSKKKSIHNTNVILRSLASSI